MTIEVELKRIADALEVIAGTPRVVTVAPVVTAAAAPAPVAPIVPATTPAVPEKKPEVKTRAAKALATALATAPAADPFSAEAPAVALTFEDIRKKCIAVAASLANNAIQAAGEEPSEELMDKAKREAQNKVVKTIKDVTGIDALKSVDKGDYAKLVAALDKLA